MIVVAAIHVLYCKFHIPVRFSSSQCLEVVSVQMLQMNKIVEIILQIMLHISPSSKLYFLFHFLPAIHATVPEFNPRLEAVDYKLNAVMKNNNLYPKIWLL